MKEENRTNKKRKALSLYEYLLFMSMIFLFSGFGLFMYVWIGNYDLFKLKWFNDPMLFLGIGFTTLVCCFLQKKYKFFDKLDSLEKN